MLLCDCNLTKLKRMVALTVMVMQLVACGGEAARDSDLTAQLEAIKARPAGKIKPPPKFETFESYIYNASVLRSPFEPPIVELESNPILQDDGIKPDENRVREPLESFSIESLTMVGTIDNLEKGLNALIRDNKGAVVPVVIGNFMGKNHGRIVEIRKNKIILEELIPNGVGGWIRRPRTIVSKDVD